jgi:hypothetical protein
LFKKSVILSGLLFLSSCGNYEITHEEIEYVEEKKWDKDKGLVTHPKASWKIEWKTK